MSATPVTTAMAMVCAHGGTGRAGNGFPRIRMSGQPVVLLGPPVTVTACPNPLPPAGTGPCQSAQFPMGSSRVRAGGTPLALQQIPGICVPTGVALTVMPTTPVRVQVM